MLFRSAPPPMLTDPELLNVPLTSRSIPAPSLKVSVIPALIVIIPPDAITNWLSVFEPVRVAVWPVLTVMTLSEAAGAVTAAAQEEPSNLSHPPFVANVVFPVVR